MGSIRTLGISIALRGSFLVYRKLFLDLDTPAAQDDQGVWHLELQATLVSILQDLLLTQKDLKDWLIEPLAFLISVIQALELLRSGAKHQTKPLAEAQVHYFEILLASLPLPSSWTGETNLANRA